MVGSPIGMLPTKLPLSLMEEGHPLLSQQNLAGCGPGDFGIPKGQDSVSGWIHHDDVTDQAPSIPVMEDGLYPCDKRMMEHGSGDR